MKLSSFAPTKSVDWDSFAEVDVTTGYLWWRKTARRAIRRKDGGYWHFVDTGEFTPDYQAETLARAWEARAQSTPDVSVLPTDSTPT